MKPRWLAPAAGAAVAIGLGFFLSRSAIWGAYTQPLFRLFLPIAISVVFLSVLAAFAGLRIAGATYGTALLFLMPFGWLGGIGGFIAGASQEAIIGAFLTGMLTIVSGLLSYVFATDRVGEGLKDLRPLLPFAITLLCVCALAGLGLGRIYKSAWDEFDKTNAIWRTNFENIDVPMNLLRQRHQLCRQTVSPANAARCDEILTK